MPMLLARIGGQTVVYGFVRAVWSIAGIVGALILSFWGGPKKKRFFISIFFTMGFAIGMIIVGMGTNAVIWSIGGFIWYLSGSLASIRNAFYATKVPVHMQGRFYAARLNANHLLSPIPYIFGGVIADKVFEPLMSNPAIASKLSWLVGTGKGSGMGLMMVISGVLTLLVMASAFLIKPIREADTLLPDAISSSANVPAKVEEENSQTGMTVES
jgi:DHA3 family macrolide efflux protein-like MFS transporter